jgi:undecaprenyl-diphosphatase
MAGAFAGDIASYVIGLRCKHTLPRMWPLRSNPQWLPNARAFVDRYGTIGIVAAKFVGPLRPMVPTTCGLLNMPWLPFLAASATSSLVWSFAFLAPSYYSLQWLKP